MWVSEDQVGMTSQMSHIPSCESNSHLFVRLLFFGRKVPDEDQMQVAWSSLGTRCLHVLTGSNPWNQQPKIEITKRKRRKATTIQGYVAFLQFVERYTGECISYTEKTGEAFSERSPPCRGADRGGCTTDKSMPRIAPCRDHGGAG